MNKNEFNEKTKWVASSAWRGQSQPVYGVAGANDTGTWEDSPCRSEVATKELETVKNLLRKELILVKEIFCETSNCFCVARYIIVPPVDIRKARRIVSKWYELEGKENTELLFTVKSKSHAKAN